MARFGVTKGKVAWTDVMGSTAGKANGASGEWAGEVIPLDELIMLLARFG